MVLNVAARAESDLFKAFACEAHAAYLVPAGNLDGTLAPAPGAGLRVATPYYGSAAAFLFLDVARFRTRGAAIPVVFGAGGLGLEWVGPSAFLPRPGAGAAMYEARIRTEDDPDRRYPFLHGGEAEFGVFAGLRWETRWGRSAFLSASARWDAVFTRPAASHIVSAALGAGWRWH